MTLTFMRMRVVQSITLELIRVRTSQDSKLTINYYFFIDVGLISHN